MIPTTDSVARIAPTALERFLRRRLLAQLAGLKGGRVRLHDVEGQVELGQDAGEPVIDLWVDDPVFYRQVATGGSVGAGEAYIEGAWQCSDLVALVQLLVRNRDLLDGMERGPARLAALLLRLWHAARANSRAGSRRNIAAHYDLGNDFFALFLSADMMYSSALFADADDTLEQASRRKLDRICRWLQLGPGDRVIEIGSGWGGFAEHAARHYGCHVTTTTISAEQYQSAQGRIQAAGLQQRVQVLQQDYRDLRGDYDKLVSIEMIEAVGAAYLPGYFAQLQQLLKPGGVALIQAITIEDHRYEQALASVDFIKRHVFPGSFIPSLDAISRARAQHSDLQLVAQEDFGESYALTLAAWRQRFLQQLPAVRAQGFDENFIRLWEFYLAYCEGGFREGSIGVSHLLLARPGLRHRWDYRERSR
jgi:cyclopropane-fatty-acyl-phospholipid synthase